MPDLEPKLMDLSTEEFHIEAKFSIPFTGWRKELLSLIAPAVRLNCRLCSFTGATFDVVTDHVVEKHSTEVAKHVKAQADAAYVQKLTQSQQGRTTVRAAIREVRVQSAGEAGGGARVLYECPSCFAMFITEVKATAHVSKCTAAPPRKATKRKGSQDSFPRDEDSTGNLNKSSTKNVSVTGPRSAEDNDYVSDSPKLKKRKDALLLCEGCSKCYHSQSELESHQKGCSLLHPSTHDLDIVTSGHNSKKDGEALQTSCNPEVAAAGVTAYANKDSVEQCPVEDCGSDVPETLLFAYNRAHRLCQVMNSDRSLISDDHFFECHICLEGGSGSQNDSADNSSEAGHDNQVAPGETETASLKSSSELPQGKQTAPGEASEISHNTAATKSSKCTSDSLSRPDSLTEREGKSQRKPRSNEQARNLENSGTASAVVRKVFTDWPTCLSHLLSQHMDDKVYLFSDQRPDQANTDSSWVPAVVSAYACPLCTARLRIKAVLCAHVREAHLRGKLRPALPKQPPKRYMTCKHCKIKRFHAEARLLKHEAVCLRNKTGMVDAPSEKTLSEFVLTRTRKELATWKPPQEKEEQLPGPSEGVSGKYSTGKGQVEVSLAKEELAGNGGNKVSSKKCSKILMKSQPVALLADMQLRKELDSAIGSVHPQCSVVDGEWSSSRPTVRAEKSGNVSSNSASLSGGHGGSGDSISALAISSNSATNTVDGKDLRVEDIIKEAEEEDNNDGNHGDCDDNDNDSHGNDNGPEEGEDLLIWPCTVSIKCRAKIYSQAERDVHVKCHVTTGLTADWPNSILLEEVPPLKCYLCDKGPTKATTWFYLKNHIFSMHPGILLAPFECLLCGKGFQKKHQALVHIPTHGDRSLFKCVDCDKSFRQRGSLDVHLRRVHGKDDTASGGRAKRRILICTICGYSTNRPIYFDTHMNKHLGVKPFKCDVCEFACTDKPALKRHMWRHKSGRPYHCHLCPYTAIQKKQLKTHLNYHHEEATPENEVVEILPSGFSPDGIRSGGMTASANSGELPTLLSFDPAGGVGTSLLQLPLTNSSLHTTNSLLLGSGIVHTSAGDLGMSPGVSPTQGGAIVAAEASVVAQVNSGARDAVSTGESTIVDHCSASVATVGFGVDVDTSINLDTNDGLDPGVVEVTSDVNVTVGGEMFNPVDPSQLTEDQLEQLKVQLIAQGVINAGDSNSLHIVPLDNGSGYGLSIVTEQSDV